MSAAENSLQARKNNSKQNLLIIDTLQGKTLTANVLQQNLQQQLDDIDDEKFVLKQKLDDITVVAETYDREFRDRMATPAPKPLKTTQDWVLAFFFIAFSLFMLAVTSFVYLKFHLTIGLILLMIFVDFATIFSVYILVMRFC